MPSVASIASTDPRPAPLPDRTERGGGSFSLLLDATAAPPAPDNPPDAPPASPPAASPAPPVQPAKQSSPADSGSAPASGDPGQGAAPDQVAATAADGSKPDKEGDAKKDAKEEQGSNGEKTVVAATDIAATAAAAAPQANLQPNIPAVTVPAAPENPKTDGGGNAPAGGAKAVADIAAAAGANAAPAANASAAIDTSLPTAPIAPGAAKPPAEDAAPVPDGPKIAAAAQVAGKVPASTPAQPSVASDDAAAPGDPAAQDDPPAPVKDPNIPRSAAIAALTEKAAPEAERHAAVLGLGERDPAPAKPLAGAPAASTPLQPDTAEAAKPAKDESAALQVANAKPAPDPATPTPLGTKTDADPAPVRLLSTPQLAQTAQPAALPEPLRVLTTSLTAAAPAPAQAATGMSLVPATPAAIAVEIAARAKDGSNQFDIRLDPPELGRIDVRLDVGKGGEVSTRLTVDRPETLQLLQNDARGLERALQSAGLKTDDGSLQFSLRQQTADGSGGQPQAPNPQLAALYTDEDDTASLGAEQYQWAARMRGGVDIRV